MSNSDNADNFSTNSFSISDVAHVDYPNNNNTNNTNNLDNAQQHSKYEKLAQDYLKTRSKLQIVKKGYKDLTDTVSQKDQSIRKYEQEVESLNFRNQQLTSRVDALQKELDTSKLNIEKISLQSHLSNSSSSNNNNSSPLLSLSSSFSTSNLANIPQSSSQSSLASANGAPKLTTHLDVLKEELQHKINENASLHRRLNELEIEFRQKIARNEQCIKQLENEKHLLEKKLESSEAAAKSSIEKLQNDKIKLELSLIQLENQLRMKTTNQEAKVNNVIKELKKNEPIDDKNTNLINDFVTFLDNLSKIYSSLDEYETSLTNLTPGVKKLSLKMASKCEQLLSQQILPMMRNKKKPKIELNRCLNDFFEMNNNLLNTYLLECTNFNPKNNIDIDLLNKKLKIYMNKLTGLFFTNNSQPNLSVVFMQIVNRILFDSKNVDKLDLNEKLRVLNDLLEKILFVLNERLALEYSLDYPSDLMTSNECVLSYLTQLKLFLQSLTKNEELAWIEALRVLYGENSDDCEAGKKETETLKSKLFDMEKETSNLNERFEFLKEKSNKDSEECERLKAKLDLLQSQLNHAQQKELKQQELISRLEKEAKLDNSNRNNFDSDFDGLKSEFYEKKIELLSQKIQQLDSKAVFYYDEMRIMLERLQIQIEMGNKQEAELHEVRDQLETTRNSYESQMSALSDHLVEINERMSKQTDENENLRHQLSLMQNSALVNGKASKGKKSK